MNKNLRNSLNRALLQAMLEDIEKEKQQIQQIKTSDEHKKAITLSCHKTHERRVQKARVALLIMLIFLTTLTSSVVIFREEIGGFIANVFETHLNVDFGNNEGASLDTIYSPSCPPEGFTESKRTQKQFEYTVDYTGNNGFIKFTQSVADSGWYNIDNEAENSGNVTVGDVECYYVNKNGIWAVYWRREQYMFRLICPDSLTWDEIERIILGIQPIDAATSTK